MAAAPTAESAIGVPDPGTADGPDGPTDLSGESWRQVVKGAALKFRDDKATDWAAALTYYGVLSLFPAVIVLFSLLGIIGTYPQTSDALLDIVADLGPDSAVDTLRSPIEDVTRSSGTAGALLGIGTLTAIWAASGYLGAFARASNAIFDVEEERPFWRMRPQQVAMTVLLLALVALLSLALVLTGPVARAVGDTIGLGSTAVSAFDIAKWPVMLVLVAVALALLFYWAPDQPGKRFRWISPGSILAVVVLVAASALFGVYVSTFGSYSATYGSLAGIVVFLLWLWIANNALLLGQELNAALERARKRETGPVK